ncbi:MAG: A/G-specific adenine glycosylase [Oxalobacter formigenes]|nr:A/G-specific adenine glycosylase [Oxalobacter formigenes]
MTAKEEKTGLPGFDFAGILTAWQKRCGRHDLPWQQTRDAYRVWLSEIMLQQTQVATVIPYYARFLAHFPTVQALAAASPDAVMAQWSGLGYYSRARNLHRCAQQVAGEYGGHFPMEPLLLEKLPGIGRSTAAAIAVFAGGRRAAIMDGNVVRVFSRIFGIAGYAGDKKVRDRLWRLAESLLPETELASYTQGLMDLGATVCTRSRPVCGRCPFSSFCTASREDRIKELPAKKPAKALPERQVVMPVIVEKGRVLLEKRPASGIWGGLLSLPELAGGFSVAAMEAVKARIRPLERMAHYEAQPGFWHAFTHFRLYILPVLVWLDGFAAPEEAAPYVWYELADMATAPLPAPVRKLLEACREKMGEYPG